MDGLGTVVQRWREGRVRAAALRAFNFMEPQQVRALALDVGVDAGDLWQAVQNGGAAPELLLRTMSVRGLDAATVSPRTMRGLETACTLCVAKRACRRALNAGTTLTVAADFCPNADTFQALGARQAA